MQTIPESTTTVQCDDALYTLAARARTRYAGEHARIDRGLVIALNHGVTLHADGTADVQSASDPEIMYHVAHGTCDCPDFQRAPDGRCKHRFAVCLVKKAIAVLRAALASREFFATYTAPDGTTHQGTATETFLGWLFLADDGLDPLYASPDALVLGGNVALANARRAEEEAAGGLAWLVCNHHGAHYR